MTHPEKLKLMTRVWVWRCVRDGGCAGATPATGIRGNVPALWAAALRYSFYRISGEADC